MKFYIAKLLQLMGIASVGFGLIYGLSYASGLGFEMKMLLLGSGFFLVGRVIEGRGAA